MDGSFTAKVVNGRLILDVPTDLPEGTEVVLVTLGEDTLPDADDVESIMASVVEHTRPD